MTVLTKPSLTVKKTPLIEETRCDEEVIEIQPPGWSPSKRYKSAVLCMGVIAALMLLMGLITALQIYEQVMNDVRRHNRLQGFCAIPLSRDIQMLEQRKAPLRWKSAENVGRVEPELQVISLMDEDPEHLLDLLREVLDIDIDDSVEKISVFNNGHPVSFVHDFEANITGIIDEERCFTMDLDTDLVLQPELFVFGLQHGDEFDVSRVRGSWRGVLPARPPAAAPALSPAHSPAHSPALSPALSREMRDKCARKPTYQLQKDVNVVIRKRAVDAPPHDYMHFAGKRIQEIEISNLAELLEYEQNNKLGATAA